MKNKLKTTGIVFVTLIFLFIGFNFFWSSYNKANNEIFILPDNFTGAVIVLFDQVDGTVEKFDKKGNRIMEIPNSGVLKTKFKFQEGFRHINYETKSGKKLRYLWPADKVWNDTLKNSINDSIYVYSASYARDYWFIVGKKNDKDSMQKIMAKKWEPYSEKKILKEGDNIDTRN